MRHAIWTIAVIAFLGLYSLHPVGRMFIVMPIAPCWWAGICEGPVPDWADNWIEKGYEP